MPWFFKTLTRDFAIPSAAAIWFWLGGLVVSGLFMFHHMKWGVTGVCAGAELPHQEIPPPVPTWGWQGLASSRMHQSTVHHALDLVVGGLASIWWWTGSVHGQVTSGHEVHGEAHSATCATTLPSGYAVGTAPMVTQVCAI